MKFYSWDCLIFFSGFDWVTVASAMFGKLAITASYGTIYIFSTEQFPTVIRNAGLGAGSTSARVGSIMAPLINLTVSNAYYCIRNSIHEDFLLIYAILHYIAIEVF